MRLFQIQRRLVVTLGIGLGLGLSATSAESLAQSQSTAQPVDPHYYQILGLNRLAPPSQIQAAGVQLLKQYILDQSPELYPDGLTQAFWEADQRISEVQEALTVLGNPALKRAYDENGFLGIFQIKPGKYLAAYRLRDVAVKAKTAGEFALLKRAVQAVPPQDLPAAYVAFIANPWLFEAERPFVMAYLRSIPPAELFKKDKKSILLELISQLQASGMRQVLQEIVGSQDSAWLQEMISLWPNLPARPANWRDRTYVELLPLARERLSVLGSNEGRCEKDLRGESEP